MMDRLRYVARTVDWRQFALSCGRCPLCGPSVFVRLFARDFGVRCVRCGAAQNTFALVSSIGNSLGSLRDCDVHLVSAGGPYASWLQAHAGRLWTSQFFDNAQPGAMVNGIRNEDLQDLTYPDATFDLVTSSEVIEHVPDDARAFAEIRRVLRPGGMLIFTVPLNTEAETTVERARIGAHGDIEHLLEPEYHDDPIRGSILAFRNYGMDITARLRAAGFSAARVGIPADPSGFGRVRPVVTARVAGNDADDSQQQDSQ